MWGWGKAARVRIFLADGEVVETACEMRGRFWVMPFGGLGEDDGG
jgi:hypothetical protein